MPGPASFHASGFRIVLVKSSQITRLGPVRNRILSSLSAAIVIRIPTFFCRHQARLDEKAGGPYLTSSRFYSHAWGAPRLAVFETWAFLSEVRNRYLKLVTPDSYGGH